MNRLRIEVSNDEHYEIVVTDDDEVELYAAGYQSVYLPGPVFREFVRFCREQESK